jgi:hypothetical protein
VHCRQRTAEVKTDDERFLCAERALRFHDLAQGSPADQLHPHANGSFEAIGPENPDHVGMAADLREQTSLVNHDRDGISMDRCTVSQNH